MTRDNIEEPRYGRFLRDSGIFDIEERINEVDNKEILLNDLSDVEGCVKQAVESIVVPKNGIFWYCAKHRKSIKAWARRLGGSS